MGDNMSKLTKEVTSRGSIKYYNEEGQLHRVDGPAIEWADGNRTWYKNGLPHRENGPAVEHATDTYKAWYINGMLHREDGPAEINLVDEGYDAPGVTRNCWYKYGMLHRVAGPAVEVSDGSTGWWLDGDPHREDGPAIEYIDHNGDKVEKWFIKGDQLTNEEIIALKKRLTMKKVLGLI